ncbi:unnamed protein product [Allacma fusca]|uniref:Uncharacterized protein n=1 Tax=Allacma fusca TaxID=39272 RepID=A0A8J2JJI7_9HEXA|nr:unnamed protein product [Allacma fusca]
MPSLVAEDIEVNSKRNSHSNEGMSIPNRKGNGHAKQQIKYDTIRTARQIKLSNNNFGMGRKSKPPSRMLQEKARSAAFYANLNRVLRPSIARQVCFHQIRQPTPVSGNSENGESSREGQEDKSSIETTAEVDCASNPSLGNVSPNGKGSTCDAREEITAPPYF